MAEKREDDPYRGFRFRLELGNIQVAGFSECSGLETEVQVEEIEEGGRNSHTLKLPKGARMSDLTLKRGLTDSTDLWDWHQSILQGGFDHQNKRPAEAHQNLSPAPNDINPGCSIVLVDEKGDDVKRWKINRALPIKWTGPDLKAGDSGVVFETLVLAHEGLIMAP